MSFTVLCVDPTDERRIIEVDNDMELTYAICKLLGDDWDLFEGTFGFDGCHVPAEEVRYMKRKYRQMTAQQYVEHVLAAAKETA